MRSAAPGAVLGGKYRLLAQIGEGGMGTVWQAEHLGLGALVAVKLIHPRESENPDTLLRFEAEAATAASMRSPHVVQILDVGSDEDTGAPFIVMELLEGETLRHRVARQRRLAPRDVVAIVVQVARALTRAHELGIVHRDLKPSNIFLVANTDSDLVKVLDFGVAKRTIEGPGLTMTGDLLGTPFYMSPEHLRSAKEVDHRSDLWALAVITIECLTGKLPFHADHLPGLALLISQGRSRLPSTLAPVPPGVDAWFLRATALDPDQRFATAAELVDELARACAGPVPVSEDVSDSAGDDSGEAIERPATVPSLPSVSPTSRNAVATGGARAGTDARVRWLRRGLLIALPIAAAALLFVTCRGSISQGPLAAPLPPVSSPPAVGPVEAPTERRPASGESVSSLPSVAPPTEEPSEGPQRAEEVKPATERSALARSSARTSASTRTSASNRSAAARSSSGTGGATAPAPPTSVASTRTRPAPAPSAPSASSAPLGEAMATDRPSAPASFPAAQSRAVTTPKATSLREVPVVSSSVAGDLLAVDPRSDPHYSVRLLSGYLRDNPHAPFRVKICVSETGKVTSVKLLKPTNTQADKELLAKLPLWRYRPYLMQDGSASPFCYEWSGQFR